jgi:hypothetical protein
MRWTAKVFFLNLAGACWASPATLMAQDITTDPAAVRLVVDDIRRLAEVLRSLEAGGDTVAVLERDYLALASPGLRGYAGRYNVTPTSMAAALARHPATYAKLDRLADAVVAQEPLLRSGFRRLVELFPGAAFPPIWFVAGHVGPGGLTRPEGAIIAAERFVIEPEDVVPLVLHELTHFQQAMVQGVATYQRVYGPDQTLLALALREGSAELIAELTTGRHINPAAERYGQEHERVLWPQFRDAMHDRGTGDWMFVRPSDPARPPDLGYWIGYRIAKTYYERAEDKSQAIRQILGLTDFTAFLRASGYAERVGR